MCVAFLITCFDGKIENSILVINLSCFIPISILLSLIILNQ